MVDVMEIIRYYYPVNTPLRQLLLKHSMQVREKACFLLDVCCPEDLRASVDRTVIENGAMLHDIGIGHCHAPSILCNGKEHYLCHGVIGGIMLRDYDPALEVYARICERHTGSGLTSEDIRKQNLPLPVQDFLPETPEEKLICFADKFFSKSGDMQEKSFDRVRESQAKFGDDALRRFDELARFTGFIDH